MSRKYSLFFVSMIALMLTAAFSTAQNATVVDSNNPLDGKAVVFESTAAIVSGAPRQGVRIKSLAGREFFVWERKQEGEETHDYWIPADSVTKIRVFERFEDATAFIERQMNFKRFPSGGRISESDGTRR